MLRGILYTVIVIILFYLLLGGFTSLFSFIFTRESLLDIDNSYLLFLDSFFYLVLISIAIIYIKKYSKNYISKSKIDLRSIFQIIIIIILFRLMEDPLLRMDIIIGNNDTPIIKGQEIKPTLEIVNSILSIVFLGPVFEELLFRKIILGFFIRKHLIVGIILSSLFFAFIHSNSSFSNLSSMLSSFIFGIIACFIYLRKGLFYSILFHVGYNTLWIVLKEYEIEYWNILQKLDFGIVYWLFTIIPLGLVLYFGFTNVKQTLYGYEPK